MSEWVYTPSAILQPYSGRATCSVQWDLLFPRIPGDDDEIRKKPATGRRSPTLFLRWQGFFYMPSRKDTAGHTNAFDYPVAEHWGGPVREMALEGPRPT